ncbi:MAG: GGDEF domain-containing protein [Eggerthellaceae bacterium]|nr:GGDEF domain-containing protein [Eggerthellaceae bacterium]MBQ9044295.1 GGDEF domain-containing protein [Eggerthellaceae bacterium]
MEIFRQIISVDFVVLVTLLYLALFMWFNRAYDREINRRIGFALILLAPLAISDNIDYWYSIQATPDPLHPVFIMAGYILRVWLVYTAIMIIRQSDRLSRVQQVLLLVPAIVNTAVILTVPVNPNVFWIDASNTLHREPLSFVPHVASGIYFIIALYIAAKRCRQGFVEEGSLLIVAMCTILVAVISEIVLSTRGILISAILLMLAFYYLYVHIAHFKRDNLTGAFNRMTFFADLSSHKTEDVTALAEFDINDLKAVNDMHGHAEGDKVIHDVAAIILDSLPAHCHLYRLGGDEFAALFRECSLEEAEKVFDKIRNEFDKAGLSCAAGISEWGDGEEFQTVYNRVDARMYEDKNRLKATAQD